MDKLIAIDYNNREGVDIEVIGNTLAEAPENAFKGPQSYYIIVPQLILCFLLSWTNLISLSSVGE